MDFQFINLPTELLVKIFGLLDFGTFLSMRSTCQNAKNVTENSIKLMPKKKAKSIGIYYGYRRVGNSLSIVETCFTDKNKHTLTFGSDEKLKRYLSNLKITGHVFIDEYNQSFSDHFTVGSLVENVEMLELSNIKKPLHSSDFLPLFKAFKKLNQFFLEAGDNLDGRLSILLEQMHYCFSVRVCGKCNLEIDDECLQLISSKSTRSTPFLQLFAPESLSSITLLTLIKFIRSTHFSQNASISLSRVIGSRHELITSFFPLIELDDSEATFYDFKAVINVCESKNIFVRLNICNLEMPAAEQ